MDTLTLLLAVLAVARLTRLVTEDTVFDTPRSAVLRALTGRWGAESRLAYMLVCPWCISVYAGAGVAAAWWAWGDARWFTAVCAALAASHVAGFLAGFLAGKE